MMNNEFFNFEPNLDCPSNEPSIRELIFKYYSNFYCKELANDYTKQYIRAILQQSTKSQNKF